MSFHLRFHSFAEGVHVKFVECDGRDKRLNAISDLIFYVLQKIVKWLLITFNQDQVELFLS